MANADLIQCADHKWAPWSIVCKHLVEGTSDDWRPIPSSSLEVDFDWMCPACESDHERDQDDVENLRAICIHCVRKLRGET